MNRLIGLMLLSLSFSVRSQTFIANPSDTLGAKRHNGIQWIKDLNWDKVKEKAKRENKYIFIDAFATWCGPCKKMEREVYGVKEIGELMNPNFISVKLQMDKTTNDDQLTKEWYPITELFRQQYDIDGYPTLLFVDSTGKLLSKEVGFHDVAAFSKVIKVSLTDPESQYKISIQRFRNGMLPFSLMPDLIRHAWAKKDQETAVEIARVFKEEYVDSLSDSDAFSKSNLSLLAEFSYELLKSDDRYFRFFFSHSTSPDSTINQIFPGQGFERCRFVVQAVIGREINDRIYKNGKPVTKPKPNWSDIHASVKREYGKLYYDIFFPETEIAFYDDAKDWRQNVRYVNKKIKKRPPRTGGRGFGSQFGDEWTVNYYAWRLFLKCDDKKILRKALPWSNIAIRLEQNPGLKANYIDTKANLLYKMGERDDAIKLEGKALELCIESKDNSESIKKVLQKMQSGQPTWE